MNVSPEPQEPLLDSVMVVWCLTLDLWPGDIQVTVLPEQGKGRKKEYNFFLSELHRETAKGK